ncbi:hypothetical protein BDZ45DRAFT_692266 [Acephala macrosclerotiorum]|nr:hypothetical protein BDZ45DRAFT_692266 [Acephala macrosclerotiorum]
MYEVVRVGARMARALSISFSYAQKIIAHSASKAKNPTSRSGDEPRRPERNVESTKAKISPRNIDTEYENPTNNVTTDIMNTVSLRGTEEQQPEFPLFEKLPDEIQITIWRMSFKPRFVDLRFSRKAQSTQYDLSASLPVALHVNTLSREESKKHYKILFVNKYCQRATYFNAEIDTLQVMNGSGYQFSRVLQHLPDKEKLKKLCMSPFTSDFWFQESPRRPSPALLSFTRLEYVLLPSKAYPSQRHAGPRTPSYGFHDGPCEQTIEGCRHCFPAIDKVHQDHQSQTLGPGITLLTENQSKVEKLLNNLKSGKWSTNNVTVKQIKTADNEDINKGNEEGSREGILEWNEPVFEYKGQCEMIVSYFAIPQYQIEWVPRPRSRDSIREMGSRIVVELPLTWCLGYLTTQLETAQLPNPLRRNKKQLDFNRF